MNAVEFLADLSDGGALQIPPEAAARLPKSGRARVIVLTLEDQEEACWREGSCEQFLREDPPEDSIYESLR